MGPLIQSQMSPWLHTLLRSIFTGLPWQQGVQQSGLAGMPQITAQTALAQPPTPQQPGRSEVYTQTPTQVPTTGMQRAAGVPATMPSAPTPAQPAPQTPAYNSSGNAAVTGRRALTPVQPRAAVVGRRNTGLPTPRAAVSGRRSIY